MEQESDHAVANQGERPGGTAPLFLDQTEDRKQLFGDRPLPPFFFVKVWMTGPHPYLKIWIRHCHG